MSREFEAPDLIEVMEEAVNYNRFLADLLADCCGDRKRVLDFGAGNGRFALALNRLGVDVTAVEPDATLRAKITRAGIPAKATLEATRPGCFDALYTVNVLEHVEDDRGLLAAFYERLVPGGRLLVYVPAFDVLFSANDERVGHVRRYRKAQLVERIAGAGFEIESATYVDSLGFFAALVYRYLGNRDGGLNVAAVKIYDSVIFPVSRRLDRVLGSVFGKNLLVRARRPAQSD